MSSSRDAAGQSSGVNISGQISSVGGDVVGRDKQYMVGKIGPGAMVVQGERLTIGFTPEQLLQLLQAAERVSGQSGGINIPGTVGNVAGDIVGRDRIAIANVETFVQGIDADVKEKISETQDNVAQVLDVIKGGVTRLRSTDESFMFAAARREAERMCNTGRPEDASRAFMEALEREDSAEQQRREDHGRLRVRLLEEAIAYDKKALNADAAFVKLRLIAETIHPGDGKAQAQFLFRRGSEYQDQGKLKGDNAALFVAVSVFSWLAKETIDVERA